MLSACFPALEEDSIAAEHAPSKSLHVRQPQSKILPIAVGNRNFAALHGIGPKRLAEVVAAEKEKVLIVAPASTTMNPRPIPRASKTRKAIERVLALGLRGSRGRRVTTKTSDACGFGPQLSRHGRRKLTGALRWPATLVKSDATSWPSSGDFDQVVGLRRESSWRRNKAKLLSSYRSASQWFHPPALVKC